jgi:hypothetical protein
MYHSLVQNSEYKPYIDILPTNFASNPLTWTDADLEELQASPIRVQISTLRNSLVAAHERLVKSSANVNNVFTDNSFTFDRYLWAFLVVNSRTFNTAQGAVLVPLVDMLNHDPNAVCFTSLSLSLSLSLSPSPTLCVRVHACE